MSQYFKIVFIAMLHSQWTRQVICVMLSNFDLWPQTPRFCPSTPRCSFPDSSSFSQAAIKTAHTFLSRNHGNAWKAPAWQLSFFPSFLFIFLKRDISILSIRICIYLGSFVHVSRVTVWNNASWESQQERVEKLIAV